jgi:hypothetical protein
MASASIVHNPQSLSLFNLDLPAAPVLSSEGDV